jgi:phage shock protein A
MTDTLKTRVAKVIAGGIHALLDRLEDQAPEAMMEQSIREAEVVVNDVRHELGVVSANRHLAQQQHASLNTQHARLVEQIEQGLQAGREDLARAAVARQLDIEAQLPVLESVLAEHARQENELHGFVGALQAKKREMEETLAQFRASRAPSLSTLPAGTARGAIGAEQRLEKVVGAFDRIHERQTGLAGTTAGATVQQARQLKELDELVRENKIAERLAQIRAGQA